MRLYQYKLKRFLLSFVYPNRCPFCDAVINSQDYFCAGCVDLDFFDNEENWEKSGNSGNNLFCCIYNDKSKPLINKAKENADGYAVSALSWFLCEELTKRGVMEKIDVIIPVPARKTALKKRGYSLPALLAKEVAAISGKIYSGKSLIILREPKEQKGLSAVERAENLNGAFAFLPTKGKLSPNILVIDDISTTGATLKEAKRAISEAFPFSGNSGEVYGAAFAKTMFMQGAKPEQTTPSPQPQPQSRPRPI